MIYNDLHMPPWNTGCRCFWETQALIQFNGMSKPRQARLQGIKQKGVPMKVLKALAERFLYHIPHGQSTWSNCPQKVGSHMAYLNQYMVTVPCIFYPGVYIYIYKDFLYEVPCRVLSQRQEETKL